jgi:predicted dinucleotide-binding enzyme
MCPHALPDVKVVKAFNTIRSPYCVDPSFSEGQPTMLIAGDDEGAERARVAVYVVPGLGWG